MSDLEIAARELREEVRSLKEIICNLEDINYEQCCDIEDLTEGIEDFREENKTLRMKLKEADKKKLEYHDLLISYMDIIKKLQKENLELKAKVRDNDIRIIWERMNSII